MESITVSGTVLSGYLFLWFSEKKIHIINIFIGVGLWQKGKDEKFYI